MKPKDIHSGLKPEDVRRRLRYDADTGYFFWTTPDDKRWNGRRAGCSRSDGSWAIRIGKRIYKAHRLVWFYVHGRWPKEEIDHINRDRLDNRLRNLREATRVQNQINVVLKNKTGFQNVDFINGKYRARARINGKTTHLGMRNTPEEAHSLAMTVKRSQYGDFVPR